MTALRWTYLGVACGAAGAILLAFGVAVLVVTVALAWYIVDVFIRAW